MRKKGTKDDRTAALFGLDERIDAADGFEDDVKTAAPSPATARESWRVRLYPFERYKGYGKVKNTEAEAMSYATWLKGKTGKVGNAILLERGGLVWALWTYENNEWTEDAYH